MERYIKRYVKRNVTSNVTLNVSKTSAIGKKKDAPLHRPDSGPSWMLFGVIGLFFWVAFFVLLIVWGLFGDVWCCLWVIWVLFGVVWGLFGVV